MRHAGGNVHHVVLADEMSLSIDDQRALAAFDDVDIVGLAMAMPLSARSAGCQPGGVHGGLFGTGTRIDQFDLFSPSSPLPRSDRTLVQMQDLEHARSPQRLRRSGSSLAVERVNGCACRGSGRHAILEP